MLIYRLFFSSVSILARGQNPSIMSEYVYRIIRLNARPTKIKGWSNGKIQKQINSPISLRGQVSCYLQRILCTSESNFTIYISINERSEKCFYLNGYKNYITKLPLSLVSFNYYLINLVEALFIPNVMEFLTFTPGRVSATMERGFDGSNSGSQNSVAERCITREAFKILCVGSSVTIHDWRAETLTKVFEAEKTSWTWLEERDESKRDDDGWVHDFIPLAEHISVTITSRV